MTVYVNGVNTSLVAESLSDVDASADELNVTDGLMVPMVFPMPFTINDRGGVGSDGLMWGTRTQQTPYVDAGFHYDSSTTTYTSMTTQMGSETTGDVVMPDPFDTNDALYIGGSAKWCHMLVDIATAGAGDSVAGETVWEYYNGSTWETLETGFYLKDDSTALTASAGNKIVTFQPPSDWAQVAVNSNTKYWIRFRATADDVYNTTQPVLDRVILYPLASAADGFLAPATGTITQAFCHSNILSASNNDTVILIINRTTGDTQLLTWTKADAIDVVTGLSLAVTAGDKLVMQILQEDGTTEFAFGSITLYITA